MCERSGTTRGTGASRATRRETLGRLGHLGGGMAVAGGYAVLRIRRVKPDHSGDELNALVETGFVPQVRALPGFVSYIVLWNAETRDWVSISTFTDKPAAERSTEVATAFGEASGTRDFVEGDPIVVEAAVVIAVGQDA
jgi:hypothetical protein